MLVALSNLLVALALTPLLLTVTTTFALSDGWVLLTVVTLTLAFIALQYLALTEGDARPYISHSQAIMVAAATAGLAATYWLGPMSGLLLTLTLGQSALMFMLPSQRLVPMQCLVSFIIGVLALLQTDQAKSLPYLAIYGVLLPVVLLLQAHTGNWRWQYGVGYLLCVVSLIGLAGFLGAAMPRWPHAPTGKLPLAEEIYSDASWGAKAQDLRDGRLPAQILPPLQQQFLLQSQTATPKTLRDYAYQAAGISQTFSYPAFANSFEINNFASRLAWVSQPVAQVEAATPMNLRAKIFDEFDGIRWHNSATKTYPLAMPYQQLIWRSEAQSSSQSSQYRVHLLAAIGSVIPLAGQLDTLQFPADSLAMDAYGLLQSPASLRPGTVYQAYAHSIGLGERRVGDATHLQHPNYLQLPANFDPRIKSLAQQLTTNSHSQLQQAEQLEAHLRQHYEYHFQTVAASVGVIPVTDFLFETHRGTGEYFATSLALMLRSLDIPARLVSGFAVQRQNPFSGRFDVLGADAHTWVEAYVDNKGWVELEPMAFYQLPVHTQPPLLGFGQMQLWHQQQQALAALQKTAFDKTPPALSPWTLYFSAFYLVLSVITAAALVAAIYLIGLAINQNTHYLNWRKNQLIRRQRRKTDTEDPAAAPLACLATLFKQSGRQLAAGATIEHWAPVWQSAVPGFNPTLFIEAFHHYYFGLNTQGDLPGQCTALLNELEKTPWSTIKQALNPGV